MRKRRVLATAFGLVLLAQLPIAPQTLSAAAAPTFKLTWPKPNSVVNNGTFLIAKLGKAFPRADVKKVVFEYSKNGTLWNAIDGAAPPALSEFAALWNTHKVAPGEYDLRARLLRKNKPPRVTSYVPVVVNDQPTILGRIDHLEMGQASIAGGPEPGKVRVHFDTVQNNVRGSLEQPQWKFHDDSTTTGPTAFYDYPAETGDYELQVSVEDSLGGEMVSQHSLKVTEQDVASSGPGPSGTSTSAQMTKKETCGCESMMVKTTGAIEPPGFSYGPPGGPASTTLGPINTGFYAGICRFEVIAKLKPGSVPHKCAEGIRFQKTRIKGDTQPEAQDGVFSAHPAYDSDLGPDDPYTTADDPREKESGECPMNGPKWCDGDHHGGGSTNGEGKRGVQPPNPYKKHGESDVYMLLSPSSTESDSRARLRYEAVVKGPDGECRCTWGVLIVKDREGNVIKNEVTDIECDPQTP